MNKGSHISLSLIINIKEGYICNLLGFTTGKGYMAFNIQ